MGRRPLLRRCPLTRNQQTIFQYFKKSQKPKVKRRVRIKHQRNEDDDSYVLPSNTDETDDYSELDLDDEEIDSQLQSPVIELDEDEEEPKIISIKHKPKKRKTYKPAEKKEIIFIQKKRGRGRPRKYQKNEERKKPTKKKIIIIHKRGRGRPRKYEDNKEKKEIKVAKMKNENDNDFNELNLCYNKLEYLISKYSFTDIADVILKLNNNIPQDKSDKNEKILFKEISNINSVIKKKEDINTMCLCILASKKSNNEINNNCDKKEEKEEENSSEDNFIKNAKTMRKRKSETLVLQSFKELDQINYKFGMHLFDSGNGVYIYDPMTGVKRTALTLYCRQRTASQCRAKCVVYSNSDDITMKCEHNHEAIPYKDFYKAFPELRKKNWEHAQVIKEGGKDIIIIMQC